MSCYKIYYITLTEGALLIAYWLVKRCLHSKFCITISNLQTDYNFLLSWNLIKIYLNHQYKYKTLYLILNHLYLCRMLDTVVMYGFLAHSVFGIIFILYRGFFKSSSAKIISVLTFIVDSRSYHF